MEWFLIYLLVMVDQIREAASSYGGWIAAATAITFGMGFIAAIYWAESRCDIEEKKKYLKKGRNWLLCLWMIPMTLGTVHTLLPSQKNMALIVGTGLTYQAVTSETGQRIGGKAVELLEKKINEALESGEKEEVKEKEKPAKESGSKESTQAT